MGCTRLTYQKNKTPLKVVYSKTPFFLNQGDDKKQGSPKKCLNVYKYKYNSAEWQDEFNLNMYDLGVRGHDPARVQFGGIDPRAEEYYSQSPYVFAANNPVFYVDINGEGVDENEWIPKVNNDGSTSYVAEKGDSVGTFMSQYGVSKEHAETLVGCDPVVAGETEVSGQDVWSLNPYDSETRSGALKLDLNSSQATDDRVLQQFVFANDFSKSVGKNEFSVDQFYSSWNDNKVPSTGIRYTGNIVIDGGQYKVSARIRYYISQGHFLSKEGMSFLPTHFSNDNSGGINTGTTNFLGKGNKTLSIRILHGVGKGYSSNRYTAFIVNSRDVNKIQQHL